jgi:hypothetical protein
MPLVALLSFFEMKPCIFKMIYVELQDTSLVHITMQCIVNALYNRINILESGKIINIKI